MTPLIICDNLTIGYNDTPILKNISFEICRGDYLTVLGENGAGKSTLIKTLAGLIKPLSGKISYNNGLKPNQIGYLPQKNGISSDFPASSYEIVISGCLNRHKISPFYSKEDIKSANNALSMLEISDISKKSFNRLSGGQQQRVLLARSLCSAHKILILDEPVSSLDPVAQNDFYKIMEKLNNNMMTLIIVSHDPKRSLENSSKILYLGANGYFYGSSQQYAESDYCKKFTGDN